MRVFNTTYISTFRKASNLQISAKFKYVANNDKVFANDTTKVSAIGEYRQINEWFDCLNDEFKKQFEFYK